MSPVDWWVIAAYLVCTLVVGLWLSQRAKGGLVDFFVGGRALPWWLAGTSMAATTFSVDTPLYVSALIARRGIATVTTTTATLGGHGCDAGLLQQRFDHRSDLFLLLLQ